MTRYVTTDLETILDAVERVMACVPRPWTRIMVEDAVDLVLHFADEWRSCIEEDVQTLELDNAQQTFLTRRLGLTECQAEELTVVAE